jgi:hypothetical protein
MLAYSNYRSTAYSIKSRKSLAAARPRFSGVFIYMH